eukprot:209913_1
MLAIIALILSVITLLAETASDDCHGDCSQEDRVLQINAFYSFAPHIHYNLQNIQCLLHETFTQWFAAYEFVNTFETCDIHIIYTRGGFAINNDTLCNSPPCIYAHSKQSTSAGRRRLLGQIDGNTTMALIPHNEEVTSYIQNIALNDMEHAFEDQFYDTFGLTITVQIDVEVQHKIDNTLAAYFIYVPVIVLVLICCVCAGVIYYYKRSKTRRDSDSRAVKVVRTDTQQTQQTLEMTENDENRETIDYERNSITETEVLDANLVDHRANNPVLPPQDNPPVGMYVGSPQVPHHVGTQYNQYNQYNHVGTQPMYPVGSALAGPNNMNNNAGFNDFNHFNAPPPVGSQFNGPAPVGSQFNGPAAVGSQLGNVDSPFGGYYSTGSHQYRDASTLSENQNVFPNQNAFQNYNPNVPPLNENPYGQYINQYPPQNAYPMNNNQGHPMKPSHHHPQKKPGYMIVDDTSSLAGSSVVTFPTTEQLEHTQGISSEVSTLPYQSDRTATVRKF